MFQWTGKRASEYWWCLSGRGRSPATPRIHNPAWWVIAHIRRRSWEHRTSYQLSRASTLQIPCLQTQSLSMSHRDIFSLTVFYPVPWDIPPIPWMYCIPHCTNIHTKSRSGKLSHVLDKCYGSLGHNCWIWQSVCTTHWTLSLPCWAARRRCQIRCQTFGSPDYWALSHNLLPAEHTPESSSLLNEDRWWRKPPRVL